MNFQIAGLLVASVMFGLMAVAQLARLVMRPDWARGWARKGPRPGIPWGHRRLRSIVFEVICLCQWSPYLTDVAFAYFSVCS
jgi:hypothetical protein